MVQEPSYWKAFTRRKVLTTDGTEGETKLNRVLGLFDLTALGVGSTLGAGIYVLAGQIAKDQAGPSVIISFAIAALASLLAGVCYAEFGARVPKAGSAYVYSYVCIGEFVAFVIGWNLILEYIIGTASVCRAISIYVDTLFNDALKHAFASVAPMHVSFLGSYFDFFACALVIVFGVALAFGVETTTVANNVCTCLNIGIIIFIIIAGSIKANLTNWTIDVKHLNTTAIGNVGNGGFFPFGIAGTLKGAATCFFGFVGFDCIATTGEEVRNPRKNIPHSILLALLIIFLCYFGVSTVLTLMVPYYLQDSNAPLPYAFQAVGWNFAKWIVAVGGLIGLLASLLGALFPLPRIMYSMAEDGLLFRFLGQISPRFRVPMVGSIFAAVLTAAIAGLFDLAQLVSLLSIGTLLAYSIVSVSVIILRFMDNSEASARGSSQQTLSENSLLTSNGTRITFRAVMLQIFNCKRIKTPNVLSTRIVGSLIVIYSLLSLGIGLLIMFAHTALIRNKLWVFLVLGVLLFFMLLVLVAMCLQPREAYTRIFRVPLAPIVPAISIFINIYLMLQLDAMTWIRFGIWMAIGIPIYLACWLLNDIKNPAKRKAKIVEFKKSLKESADEVLDSHAQNGHVKSEHLEANGSLKANGGAIGTTQNDQTVKSVDEIIAMHEIGNDLIERKHPNGKIFYVEDTNITGANFDGNEKLKIYANGVEDEKSVIAMLDDVLQAEDDGMPTTPSAHGYSRKMSIDSEMLPSVIKTTTVATVHSGSDSSEKDLDDLPEDSSWDSSTPTVDYDLYKESCSVAQKLVNEILSSNELWNAIEERRNHDMRDKQGAVHSQPIQLTTIKISNSTASLESNDSFENPLHSDKFKNKLKQIYNRPVTVTTLNKPTNGHTETKNFKTEYSNDNQPEDLHVRKLILKAVEGTGIDVDDTDNLDNTNLYRDINGVPKAPKFDQELYKTINSLSLKKERPSLETFRKSVVKPSNSIPENVEQTYNPNVPFKITLEAVLKRGPSHRTQQRQELSPERPNSEGAGLYNGVHYVTDIEIGKKRFSAKSDTNLSEEDKSAAIIKDARKSLKPVSNPPWQS